MKNNTNDRPLVLIEDTSHNCWYVPKTGWDIDNRGADGQDSYTTAYPECLLHSVLADRPTTFKRPITPQSNGVLTLEANYRLIDGEGFYMCLADKDTALLKLVFRGGAFWLDGTKLFPVSYGRHYIKFAVNLDTGRFLLYSDKKYIGEFSVNGSASCVSYFACGFAEEDIGNAALTYSTKLYKNYHIYDLNVHLEEGALPAEYTVTTVGRAKAQNKHFGCHLFDTSYQMEAGKDSSVTVARAFDRTGDDLIFTVKYLLRDRNGALDIGLYDEGGCAFRVSDAGMALEACGGALKKHSFDVWQTLRAEVNFTDRTVLIKLNGKKITVLAFEDETLSHVNRMELTLRSANGKKTTAYFGEVFAYPSPEEPTDYVPEPIVPKKKGDTYVGMNICPLWRTGEHRGWDCITPFDEVKPIMGYYDEGLPETADWEIKFLAEHGVDFELYCWYSSQNSVPMRSTHLGAAWYEGHMNAKYSDKCKFALLWEAAASVHFEGNECFRKILVPYWIDYFFSDERYMAIDNKAFMSVYNAGGIINMFGGPEKTKIELDYLRGEVKKLGYDDLIIAFCDAPKEIYKLAGFDCSQAYNWGKQGDSVEQTKNLIRGQTETGHVHVIPTVSTGFNNVAWAGTRSPNMTPEGMRETLTWCRDEMLPRAPKGSWKSKLVLLSNWNEYGEGTYICPSGLNQFGYLDAVRDVFCEDVPHTDVIPSENQKSRICLMHPKDRRKFAKDDRLKPDLTGGKVLYTYTFKDKADMDKWEFEGFSKLELADGRLVGHSDRYDPYMLLKGALPFDPDKVSHIIVNIRAYKPVDQVCCTEIFFKNDFVSAQCAPTLTVPERIAPLPFMVYNNPEWRGNIVSFRLDPIWGVGDFILESVEFMAAPEHISVYLDGLSVSLPVYATERGGEVYFALDPNNTLAKVKELYYEWNDTNKQLTLYGKHTAVLTRGSNELLLDGETRMLAEPFSFLDGMPLLPLSLYAEVVGYNLDRGEGEAYLTTAK